MYVCFVNLVNKGYVCFLGTDISCVNLPSCTNSDGEFRKLFIHKNENGIKIYLKFEEERKSILGVEFLAKQLFKLV